MRLPTIAVFATLLMFFSAASAAAQVNGSREELLFVAETNVPASDGGMMSLCHLVDHQVLLFMPVFTWSKEYVWAENQCDGGNYYESAAFNLGELKDQGLIYPDIPDTPVLPGKIRVKNGIVGGAVGLIGLFLAFNFIRRKYRAVMG